jgi:hypothetical protein
MQGDKIGIQIAPSGDDWPAGQILAEPGQKGIRRQILKSRRYRMTHQELADVMGTFDVLRRREEQSHGEFRTKQLVLEAFDRLYREPTMKRAPATKPRSFVRRLLRAQTDAPTRTAIEGDAGAFRRI